jgi:LysR family glycine cleavage system transcriptional activator
MRKRIPSTMALTAFEAAARHESFTRAAEELALTQSAVCRQIGLCNLFSVNFRGVGHDAGVTG